MSLKKTYLEVCLVGNRMASEILRDFFLVCKKVVDPGDVCEGKEVSGWIGKI